MHFARNRINGKTLSYFGAIPLVVNEKVDFWVQYFKSRGRREFMTWLVRAESAQNVVNPVLKEHGIPMELFYLAMVESGFNNRARSSARATGTWQFMKGTAKIYGLSMDHWTDERRDPVKSTVAAASYLRDLYQQLGDWYLAMAAYNAGPGKVRKAIRRAKTRDFWKIIETRHLPRETKQYVPKVLAAILLAAERKAHGFEVSANPSDIIPSTTVAIEKPVLLSEVAEKLGIKGQVLRTWNPELIAGITPPGKESYQLRIASSYVEEMQALKETLTPLEVKSVHMHKIRKGDTLSQIAHRYNVKTRQILSINPKINPKRLRIGKSVAIPVPSVAPAKGGQRG
jgi:membrane-bound lytic murein transglycosylase D